MFFSDELLTSKKGSFGIIWLAATLGPRNKKITRKQLTAINLAKTCDLIAEPPEPMALRLSGALLVGVARVYNQNYDIFYSDVTNFHSNLRRSIATDFNTSGTGTAGTKSFDIPGGGKSKYDQITFAESSPYAEMGLELHFHHIDWNNPFSQGRKRRSSSMLSSQSASIDVSDEEDSDDEEEDGDDIGSEMGRGSKRKKLTSSPAIGAYTSNTKIRHSVHHPSESTGGAMYAGMDVPIEPLDLELNLDDFDGGTGNDSFSGPSGRGFELPTDGGDLEIMIDAGDLVPPSRQGSFAPGVVQTPSNQGSGLPLESAMKSREYGEGSQAGSVEDVEQELGPVKRKTKRIRKVTFDDTQELDHEEDRDARRRYREDMIRERSLADAKTREKDMTARATLLVDGAGGLEFFDSDMNMFFSGLTKIDKFKWELDVAAQRQGNEGIHVGEENEAEKPEDGEWDISGGGDGGLGLQGMESTYQDVFQDFEVPIQEVSTSGRQGSVGRASIDPEYARRASQGSQQGPLPWEERPRSTTPGFANLQDMSDSPGSLRLSVMTPQEARLRSRSNPGSWTGPESHRQGRYRSSSLISNRADDDPLLLAFGDDLDLPIHEDELQLESLASSQQARLNNLPQAFRPEMLATLEKQCRDFLTYVERKMLTMSLEELDFEDLAPLDCKKHVAALAFYDCLTLATKRILSLSQEEPWGQINVEFAVESS
ncbi:uncharacterized protein IL334_007071 [Kwoniella shivajii]|uniref:Rad21/Rec8-like protein N-terminal domain-containing protein n=1 Tax=Kwoniella shivajii TaxID=564305 RepID=A0ABZ1DBN0_9TREE|nr:hypothetical protein IL334_007071 [Kwoniella shivajii]